MSTVESLPDAPEMSLLDSPPRYANLAELLDDLGVPANRVCYDPAVGTATESDLLRARVRDGKLYELVDGTLVEKAMGHPESFLAMELGFHIRTFLAANNLGYLAGADDLIEVLPDLVRGPDVNFVSWLDRPDGRVNADPISRTVPRLAVEVISPSNTQKEITRKLGEYFRGGVRLVWVIDHRRRAADMYTAADAVTTIDAAGAIDGGDVLPGFRLPLAELFARLPDDAAK